MPKPIPAPREEGFTTTTETPLYWVTYGRVGAPRLLVLHGGPGADHQYLLPQMLHLGEKFDLLFYDQRGGGKSRSDARAPVTWRTHVEDLDGVTREFSVDPLSIVGYSLSPAVRVGVRSASGQPGDPEAEGRARRVRTQRAGFRGVPPAGVRVGRRWILLESPQGDRPDAFSGSRKSPAVGMG